jgi:hypothetical protein
VNGDGGAQRRIGDDLRVLHEDAHRAPAQHFPFSAQPVRDPLGRRAGGVELPLGCGREFFGVAVDCRQRQVLLAGEVVVHAALAGVGALLDGFRAGARVAALAQQLAGALDQPIAGGHGKTVPTTPYV